MRALIASLWFVCAIAPAVGREALPHACPLPEQLALVLPGQAEARINAAERERASLSAEIADFEGQCRSVEVGSRQYNVCVGLNDTVNVGISAYLQRLEDHKAALVREGDQLRAGAPTRIAELDTQIASTRARLVTDGKQVRGIEAAAKEWEDAAEGARLEMRDRAFSTLRKTFVDFGLKWIGENRRREIQLDEKQVSNIQRAIRDLWVPPGVKLPKDKLESLLILDHRWTAHGHKFGLRLTGNRSNVRVLQGLKKFNTVLSIVDAQNGWLGKDDKREDILKSYATTLKLLVKDPEFKFLINQWDLNFSLAYLFVTEHLAMERIEQLDRLGLESLKGIEALSALHKRQIQKRTAMRRLQTATGAVDARGCPI